MCEIYECHIDNNYAVEVLSAEAGDSRAGRWLKKSQLFDSKKSVNDVKFAPRYDPVLSVLYPISMKNLHPSPL